MSEDDDRRAVEEAEEAEVEAEAEEAEAEEAEAVAAEEARVFMEETLRELVGRVRDGLSGLDADKAVMSHGLRFGHRDGYELRIRTPERVLHDFLGAGSPQALFFREGLDWDPDWLERARVRALLEGMYAGPHARTLDAKGAWRLFMGLRDLMDRRGYMFVEAVREAASVPPYREKYAELRLVFDACHEGDLTTWFCREQDIGSDMLRRDPLPRSVEDLISLGLLRPEARYDDGQD